MEIKEQLRLAKNGHVVLYSVSTVHEDEKKAVTIEPAPKTIDNEPVGDTSEHEKETKVEVINEDTKKEDKIGDESKTKVEETHVKLETVNENPKEERSVH